MCRLEILGPMGRRILEWDPDKLHQRAPSTLETVAEADNLFKEAVAYNRTHIRVGGATAPQMAVLGRWLA
jgi:hypothetical protein